MIKPVAVTYSGPVPGNITKRDWNNFILKPAWEDVGRWFHEDRIPIRFTDEAEDLLGLEPRKGEELGASGKQFWRSYTGRKQRRFGHTKPFVWSGESERLATKIQDVRSTAKGVAIVIHARTLNRHNKHSKIRMNEEIRRIAPEEYPMVQRKLDEAVQYRLDQFNKTRTVEL